MMFSGRWEAKQQEDGSFFIDRDAFVFRHVLNYLRGQQINLEVLSSAEIDALEKDADFYLLDKTKLFPEL